MGEAKSRVEARPMLAADRPGRFPLAFIKVCNSRCFTVSPPGCVLGKPAYFLTWNEWEMDSLMLYAPSIEYEPFYMPTHAAHLPETQKLLLPAYPKLLASKPIILTAEAEKALADPARSISGTLILEFLRKTYRLEEIVQGRFRGKFLRSSR